MEKFSPVCKAVCNAGAILNHFKHVSALLTSPFIFVSPLSRSIGWPCISGHARARKNFQAYRPTKRDLNVTSFEKREMYFMPAWITSHLTTFFVFSCGDSVWITSCSIIVAFMEKSQMTGLSDVVLFHWNPPRLQIKINYRFIQFLKRGKEVEKKHSSKKKNSKYILRIK